MNPEEFRASTSGKVIRTVGGYWAFVPHPLPPPIQYDPETVGLLSDADRGLEVSLELGSYSPTPACSLRLTSGARLC